MKKIFFIITILIYELNFGQIQINKDNISTAGGSQTHGNLQVVYTVGEIAVQENTVNNMHLSEGFIDPMMTSLGIKNFGNLSGVKLYPNPVDKVLHIHLPGIHLYHIYLYNLDGQQLLTANIKDISGLINLSHIKTGIYMLIVIDSANKQKGIYKIQKL